MVTEFKVLWSAPNSLLTDHSRLLKTIVLICASSLIKVLLLYYRNPTLHKSTLLTAIAFIADTFCCFFLQPLHYN